MDYIYYFLFGLIQGITEFFPVSSSGHLALFKEIINFSSKGKVIEIIAHLGTLLTIFVFFRKDIFKLCKSLPSFHLYFMNDQDTPMSQTHTYLLTIIVASIPTALIGLIGKVYFANIFESLGVVSIGFLITTLVLLLGRFKREKLDTISFFAAFIIGIAQGIAVTPGISRSGLTIVVALLLGIKFKEAFKFSFLISIPAILGASTFILSDLINLASIHLAPLFLLLVTSVVSGYMALHIFAKQVELHNYSRYTFILCIFSFLWYFF